MGNTIAEEGGENTQLDLDRVIADLNISDNGAVKINDRESADQSEFINPPSHESFFDQKRNLKKPPHITTGVSVGEELTRAGSTKMSTKSRKPSSMPGSARSMKA